MTSFLPDSAPSIHFPSFRKTAALFCAVVVMSLALVTASHSQKVGAALTGTVKDQQGALIPGEMAKATNQSTGVTTTAVTNGQGVYRITNLQPGQYEFAIDASGLSELVNHDLMLNVGAEVLMDFTLTVADVSASVDVTGQTSALDLVSSTLSYD